MAVRASTAAHTTSCLSLALMAMLTPVSGWLTGPSSGRCVTTAKPSMSPASFTWPMTAAASFSALTTLVSLSLLSFISFIVCSPLHLFAKRRRWRREPHRPAESLRALPLCHQIVLGDLGRFLSDRRRVLVTILCDGGDEFCRPHEHFFVAALHGSGAVHCFLLAWRLYGQRVAGQLVGRDQEIEFLHDPLREHVCLMRHLHLPPLPSEVHIPRVNSIAADALACISQLRHLVRRESPPLLLQLSFYKHSYSIQGRLKAVLFRLQRRRYCGDDALRRLLQFLFFHRLLSFHGSPRRGAAGICYAVAFDGPDGSSSPSRRAALTRRFIVAAPTIASVKALTSAVLRYANASSSLFVCSSLTSMSFFSILFTSYATSMNLAFFLCVIHFLLL
nr:MAG TPA: hypothetical protein [Caudoviricetes sp.]